MAGAQLWRTSSLPVCFGGLCVVKWDWRKAAHSTREVQDNKEFHPGYFSHPVQLGQVMRRRGYYFRDPKAGVSESRRQRWLLKFITCSHFSPSSAHSQWTLDPLPPEPLKQMNTATVYPWLPGERCLGKPCQRGLSLQEKSNLPARETGVFYSFYQGQVDSEPVPTDCLNGGQDCVENLGTFPFKHLHVPCLKAKSESRDKICFSEGIWVSWDEIVQSSPSEFQALGSSTKPPSSFTGIKWRWDDWNQSF